ncbi:predicted protein [Lichtheimia corymbifera JMRC:FSU:9682]|uniref:Uncharacterized protein n=1 Tax=Lichtheimia corymbifera JMRC:FSU:9682 TaxID=1263082 RepID=A0A068RKM7_9FUNG|nr:predicted protein [Lichtheimia corymbifera JMRC:FSU:9682]
MAIFNQHIGFDGWMESSAVMRYPGMLLWLLGVLCGATITWIRLRMTMDWMRLTKWIIFWRKVLYSHGSYWNAQVNACSICFTIMDEDVYGGINQEYNGTTIPADSTWSTGWVLE